jgi:hypothetical protein
MKTNCRTHETRNWGMEGFTYSVCNSRLPVFGRLLGTSNRMAWIFEGIVRCSDSGGAVLGPDIVLISSRVDNGSNDLVAVAVDAKAFLIGNPYACRINSPSSPIRNHTLAVPPSTSPIRSHLRLKFCHVDESTSVLSLL